MIPSDASLVEHAEKYLRVFGAMDPPQLQDGIIRDLLALVRRLDVPTWRCRGCGELVQPDHGALGHTRSEHHPACDGSCRVGCPVPVACGPVELA